MATQHIKHKEEEFFFFQNYGGYRLFYNSKNVRFSPTAPFEEVKQEIKSGVFYLAVHKETEVIMEWYEFGKGAVKRLKEWLDFLELPREA